MYAVVPLFADVVERRNMEMERLLVVSRFWYRP